VEIACILFRVTTKTKIDFVKDQYCVIIPVFPALLKTIGNLATRFPITSNKILLKKIKAVLLPQTGMTDTKIKRWVCGRHCCTVGYKRVTVKDFDKFEFNNIIISLDKKNGSERKQ